MTELECKRTLIFWIFGGACSRGNTQILSVTDALEAHAKDRGRRTIIRKYFALRTKNFIEFIKIELQKE